MVGLSSYFEGVSRYFGQRFTAGGIDVSRIDYPLGDIDVVRVLLLGDSMTLDAPRRRHVQRFTRMLTGGVQFVGTVGLGSVTGGIIGDREVQWWTHDGVSGDTIAQILARIPTIAASLGSSRAPHIVDILMSANDISALRTIAQIEDDTRSVIELVQSTWAGVTDPWIVLNYPAIWSSGAGAGYATKDALRVEVGTLFESICGQYQRMLFCDGLEGMSVSEQLSDGVHLNGRGAARTGQAEAAAIVSLMGRREPPYSVTPYAPASPYALVFDTPATDAGTIASDADLAPGEDSFAISIRFSLDAFPPDGSVYSIVSMGATIPAGYALAVFKVANVAKAGLSFYLTDNNSVISGNAGYPAALLELGKEYEVMIVADAAENKVGMWLNGQTVIHSVDLVALGRGNDWNISASAVKFGRNVLSGIQGKIRHFQFLKGASVPSIWDAPRYAEDCYRFGRLLPGEPLFYTMTENTGSPTETQGRAGAVSLSGVTWGTIP